VIHGVNYVFLGRKNCIFDLVDRNPEATSRNAGWGWTLRQDYSGMKDVEERVQTSNVPSLDPCNI
jgi:hypothetical protein